MRSGWECVVGSDVVKSKLARYEDLYNRYDTHARCVAVFADIRKPEDDEAMLLAAVSEQDDKKKHEGFSLLMCLGFCTVQCTNEFETHW